MFKKFKEVKRTAQEAAIIDKIREELNSTSILAGLSLNTIRTTACNLMINGKISEEFYLKVFSLNIKKYPGKAYWEIPENLEYIMSYGKKA